MKIVQIHNTYQQKGGEDVVLANEYNLLVQNGHQVVQYLRHNDEIKNYSFFQKVALLQKTTWSKNSFRQLKVFLHAEKPSLVHAHNTFPLITPALYDVCYELKIPVVQTLHNYRLLCPNGYLFRNGNICEECIGRSTFHSLKYGCYRNSRVQTFAVVNMLEHHRRHNTWQKKVDAYILMTKFAKNKFIQNVVPEKKIFLKPHFLANDPGISKIESNYFIFIGRLDETKGFKILTKANEKFLGCDLNIAGEGNSKKLINSRMKYLGQINYNDIILQLKKSIALIYPSLLYETFGLSIIEAFACSKPVIASNHGAMAEIIEDGKTGLLFEPGNAEDLTIKMKWALNNKEKMTEMGLNARKEFEEKYTAEKNYKILMDIYQKAIENANQRYRQ